MQKIVALFPEGRLFDQVLSEAVVPAAAAANVPLARLICEFSDQSKLGLLCAGLEGADLVIAEVSSRNPNVMYLVGYCHGIGKKVVLLSAHLEDFPFDKTHQIVLGYGGDRGFLKSELTQFLTHGSFSKTENTSRNGPVNAREKFLEIFGEILAAHKSHHRGAVEMENPTTFVLLDQDMDLALVQDLARKARELGLRLKLM